MFQIIVIFVVILLVIGGIQSFSDRGFEEQGWQEPPTASGWELIAAIAFMLILTIIYMILTEM
jgi:hypothetical protein